MAVVQSILNFLLPLQISGAVQKGSGGGIVDLFADNPILLGGLALLAAVPFLFSFIQGTTEL